MSGNDKRKISSLRDLPREIAPPRDLWKGIEAQITADKQAALAPPPRSARTVRLRVLAAAAVIAALAVGVWIGRSVLPGSGGPVGGAVTGGSGLTANGGVGTTNDVGTAAGRNRVGDEPGAFHAAFVMGSKYINQRAQLVEEALSVDRMGADPGLVVER